MEDDARARKGFEIDYPTERRGNQPGHGRFFIFFASDRLQPVLVMVVHVGERTYFVQMTYPLGGQGLQWRKYSSAVSNSHNCDRSHSFKVPIGLVLLSR